MNKTPERRHRTDHAAGDRFTKQAIIGAVIGGWSLALLVDAYLSFKAGTISVTLQDVIKQGLAFLVGALAKTGVETQQQPLTPVPVTTEGVAPLDVKESENDTAG